MSPEQMPNERPDRCETCRFWKPSEATHWGACHRFPPGPTTLELILEGKGTKGGINLNRWYIWPTTGPDDWCGEWQPKADPEPPAEVLARSIDTLGLSVKARSILEMAVGYRPITTIGDLIAQNAEALLSRKGFTPGCLAQVREALDPLGLKLRGD